MKSQTDMQKIFNTLATNLENVIFDFFKDDNLNSSKRFLRSLQNDLNSNEFNESLYRDIYNKTFHAGPVPDGRCHLKITCESNQKTNRCMQVWIDLDMLADKLNNYFHISPPYQYTVKNTDREANYTIPSATHLFDNTTLKFKSQPHSDRGMTNAPTDIFASNFLLQVAALSCGCVSVGSFLVLSLALTSAITLSATAISVAAITGLATGLTGITSFGLFKENMRKSTEWSDSLALPEEINIEMIIYSQYTTTPLKIVDDLAALKNHEDNTDTSSSLGK